MPLPKKLLFIFFTVLTFSAKAQTVSLITLNELEQRMARGGDTTYVVNFWATWCVPCVKEIPGFNKLSAQLKGQKAKLLFVSLDFKSKLQSAVIPAVKKLQINDEVYVINEPDQQAFIEAVDKKWSGAIPATLIVNKALNRRDFYEKDFTYPELLKVYNSK